VDLHARSTYLCVLDRDGNVLVSKNIVSAPEPFLALMHPAPARSPSARKTFAASFSQRLACRSRAANLLKAADVRRNAPARRTALRHDDPASNDYRLGQLHFNPRIRSNCGQAISTASLLAAFCGR